MAKALAPPPTNDRRSRVRTIRIGDALWKAARALAKANEESVATLLRRLIREELRREGAEREGVDEEVLGAAS